MPWYEFAPGTYEIDEFDCDSVFLLVGTERALLLDTGVGIGDLRGLVEQITDKPYDVAVSHGHMDHVGGAAWFDRIWLNEKDWDAFPYDGAVENRRGYAEMIRKRTSGPGRRRPSGCRFVTGRSLTWAADGS